MELSLLLFSWISSEWLKERNIPQGTNTIRKRGDHSVHPSLVHLSTSSSFLLFLVFPSFWIAFWMIFQSLFCTDQVRMLFVSMEALMILFSPLLEDEKIDFLSVSWWDHRHNGWCFLFFKVAISSLQEMKLIVWWLEEGGWNEHKLFQRPICDYI